MTPRVDFQGLLRWLADQGVEPDQRLTAALQRAPGLARTSQVTDREIFLALCQLNSALVRQLSIDGERHTRLLALLGPASREAGPPLFDDPAERNSMLGMVLRRAIGNRRDTETLGTVGFVRALAEK